MFVKDKEIIRKQMILRINIDFFEYIKKIKVDGLEKQKLAKCGNVALCCVKLHIFRTTILLEKTSKI